MKKTRILMFLVLALSLIICLSKVVKAAPMGTAFTYQGFLTDKGKPVNGIYDFEFKLFDANDMGTQQANREVNDLDAIDGYFVVLLDFGDGIFTGEARWLETAVRQGDSSDPCDFITLEPRLELTLSPYAIYAKTVGTVPETIAGAVVPKGGIIMWSGAISDIPSGWALCDGVNGTPDLRDRFIVGANQDEGSVAKTNVKGSLMQTGGKSSHVLVEAEIPPHVHSIRYKSSGFGTPGTDIFAATVSESISYQNTGSAGNGQPHENCPPFYALAFIMKL